MPIDGVHPDEVMKDVELAQVGPVAPVLDFVRVDVEREAALLRAVDLNAPQRLRHAQHEGDDEQREQEARDSLVRP